MGGLAYLVQEALPFEEAGEEGAGAEDLPAGELGGGHRLPHPAYSPGQDLEGPLAEAVVLQAEGAPEEVGVEAHASRVPELLGQGSGQGLHPLAAAAPSGWEASPFTAFTAAWGTLCPGAERAGGRTATFYPILRMLTDGYGACIFIGPPPPTGPPRTKKPVKGLPGGGS